MKKYVTVTEACNYLLQNTVKGVSYNSETSEMTITYNDGDRLVTETFTVGGGDTTELEARVSALESGVENKYMVTSVTTANVTSSLYLIVDSTDADDIIQWSPTNNGLADSIEAELYMIDRTAEDLELGRVRFGCLNLSYTVTSIEINIMISKKVTL